MNNSGWSIIFLIFIFTGLVSCDEHLPVVRFNPAKNKVDTALPLITTGLTKAAYPLIFEAAFFKDTKVLQDGRTYLFNNLPIGKLKIESGKIIACDPVMLRDQLPFAQLFPIGDFPVELAMSIFKFDQRVAYSRVLFTDEKVVRWEIAHVTGQRSLSLNDSSVYCYGVDAGMGSFIDSVAAKAFSKKDESTWEDVFINKSEKSSYTGYLHEFDGHNLAIFSSGYGDGCYTTYIGFDENGRPCQLLTDFGIIDWWKPEKK